MGKKNTASRMTQLRREVREDDAIREQAKDVIRRGLDGDPSITKQMLDAARGVFSFRAQQPTAECEQAEPVHRSEFNITSLFRLVCERHMLAQFGKDADAVAELEAIEARIPELIGEYQPSYDVG